MIYGYIIVLFAYALHGFANARENNDLKVFSYILMSLPLVFDVVIGDTQRYHNLFNVPAWQFITSSVIALLFICASWVMGYGIGNYVAYCSEDDQI